MLFAILIMKSILSLNAVLRHQLSLASLDIVMVSFFYYVQANFSPLQLYFEKIEMSLSIILKCSQYNSQVLSYSCMDHSIAIGPVWNDLSFRKGSFSPPSHNSHLLEILEPKKLSISQCLSDEDEGKLVGVSFGRRGLTR